MFALEAIFNGLGFALLALLAGTLAAAGWVLPGGEPDDLRRALLRFAAIALAGFLLSFYGSLLIQGAKLSGGNLPSFDLLWRYLARTQSGTVWLMREAYGLLLCGIAVWTLRRRASLATVRLLLLLALPLVATRSLMSHAAAVSGQTATAISLDAVHLVFTALWAGGLPALFWALRRAGHLHLPLSWVAAAVSRFSRLALLSVTVLAASGISQSLFHIPDLAALGGTPYGNVLLLKLTLFALMLGFGALNFFSTRPRLIHAARTQAEEPRLQKTALKRIGTESLVGLLVLFTAAFLTALPPATHVQHAQQKSTAPQSAGRIAPAEGASVKILSPKDGEVFSGDQVPVRFQFVKGKRGGHVHVYVDGELMGMFISDNGTVSGIPPGRHTLEAKVVASDHVTELDAGDRVNFIVK